MDRVANPVASNRALTWQGDVLLRRGKEIARIIPDATHRGMYHVRWRDAYSGMLNRDRAKDLARTVALASGNLLNSPATAQERSRSSGGTDPKAGHATTPVRLLRLLDSKIASRRRREGA